MIFDMLNQEIKINDIILYDNRFGVVKKILQKQMDVLFFSVCSEQTRDKSRNVRIRKFYNVLLINDEIKSNLAKMFFKFV
jgi:hypothetical protein